MTTAIPYKRLSLFYFWYYGLLGITHPFWPIFLTYQQFSATEIGLLLAVQMGTRIISPNLWGWLADKTGRRMAAIRLGSFLGMLSFVGIFFAEGFWPMMAVIATYSFFWNAVMPQFEALTLDYLGERSERYSSIRLWGSVGFIIAVVLGGYWFAGRLEDFRLAGMLCLGLIWLSTLCIRAPDNHHSSASQHSFMQVLALPPVLIFLGVSFLLQLSHGIYYTFFSLHLEAAGYHRSEVGMLWALSVLAEIALFVVMPRLLTNWSLREIFVFSLLAATLRWVLIAFCETSAIVIVFAQCLHAFSFGACHALSIEYLRRFFSGPLRGRGQAIYTSTSFGAGGAMGALMGGLLWNFSPEMTFSVAGVLSLLAAWIAYTGLDGRRYRDQWFSNLLQE